jgi:hypothetical protein
MKFNPFALPLTEAGTGGALRTQQRNPKPELWRISLGREAQAVRPAPDLPLVEFEPVRVAAKALGERLRFGREPFAGTGDFGR